MVRFGQRDPSIYSSVCAVGIDMILLAFKLKGHSRA
jgi:hypothetical protein